MQEACYLRQKISKLQVMAKEKIPDYRTGAFNG